MSGERGNPLERLLEQAARSVSGSSLHPLEVLERVRAAVEDAVAGDAAPNDIRIALHPADFASYAPALPRLREEIVALLGQVERERGLRRVGDRMVNFEQSDVVTEGSVVVSAKFADTKHRPTSAVPPGATGRIIPERGLVLTLGDGSHVPVTHTPFAIGRGPGNDLLLPGLAVSRRHAELVRGETGYVLRDLGSRNGLVVNGRRVEAVALAPGVVVVLGDFELRLERTI